VAKKWLTFKWKLRARLVDERIIDYFDRKKVIEVNCTCCKWFERWGSRVVLRPLLCLSFMAWIWVTQMLKQTLKVSYFTNNSNTVPARICSAQRSSRSLRRCCIQNCEDTLLKHILSWGLWKIKVAMWNQKVEEFREVFVLSIDHSMMT